MALTSNGFRRRNAMVRANGAHFPLPNGRTRLVLVVDGHSSGRAFRTGSPHAAAYLAALRAMTDADAAGVTHLRIVTRSNLLRDQMEATCRCRSPDLVPLRRQCLQAQQAFDDVKWR